MELEVQDAGDTRIITVRDARIDAAVAIGFKEAVRKAAAEGPARVVIDLAAVSFLDSSGLGALVAAMKLLAPDRALELAALQPNVARVFRLTRMDSVFRIHEGREEALASRHDSAG